MQSEDFMVTLLFPTDELIFLFFFFPTKITSIIFSDTESHLHTRERERESEHARVTKGVCENKNLEKGHM
jgi:hypothetical protein